ncbi:hypothetical protein [Inconstantimicrobium mannanitabidum]|uniref:Uncharacterized protein n=1 Tax=Inconstantimicrobium mannanitabidum TaxID=1604901 RepID=A0ACB5RCC2_9CLOT|nr:hypothetical protein [Clostridium sp. TW13]GKX66899.1 hypothetical protein rsdtw13_21570 [Clostridium sp. TW13]
MNITLQINTIIEFIFGNQMKIDKSVYFTVIVAQLTIYGIFLTFIQFIANIDDEGKNRIPHYLGIETKSFYINKKLKLSKIVKSEIFLVILILSLFLKPILVIFNLIIDKRMQSIIVFIWYSFAIIYMILFASIFIGCAKLTMQIKQIGENSKYNLLLDEIEENFIKESNRLLRKELEVDKLNQILILMRKLYKRDNRSDLLMRYNKLTKKLLQKYYDKKDYEMRLLVKKSICVRNQEPFEYNFQLELEILNEIIKDALNREVQDEEFIKSIFRIRMKILNKTLERKIINEVKKGKSSTNIDIEEHDREKKFFGYELILRSRKYVDLNKYLINMLYTDIPSVSEESKIIIQCENRKEISKLLILYLELVCDGKINETDFLEIFKKILYEEEFKEVLTSEVRQVYSRQYIPQKIENILKMLDDHQKVYILTYLIIYYSIYDFREEWKSFDLVKLRMLLPQKEAFVTILDENKEYIIDRFEKSEINHRFSKKMIEYLIKYLKHNISETLMTNVFNSKVINTFYLFVFKIGILNEEVYHLEYHFNSNKSLRLGLLRFLSKHPELFVYDKFMMFLHVLRNNSFNNEKDLGDIENDLTCLILSNVKITNELITKWREEGKYLWPSLIKYLLVKITEFQRYSDSKNEKWLINNINQDFVSSNKSVEMYVKYIISIYEKYHLDLSYVQKEKMNKFISRGLLELM